MRLNENTLVELICEVIDEAWDGIDDITDEDDLTREAIKKGFKYVAYHNTNKPYLNNYGFDYRESGIHLGSFKAAEDRASLRDLDDEHWTHKYFIKINNPLVVDHDFDWEGATFDDWHSPDDDEHYDDLNVLFYLQDLGFEVWEYDQNGNVLCARYMNEILADKGYDCIIYKNEKEDKGKYSVAMFNPNNIKLAAITYDDDGNEIPLEKRFDTSTDDVRY